MKLTKLGPGKFSYLVDEILYSLTLHGCDDECGTVEDIGWHGRLNGPLSAEDVETYSADNLSVDDRCYLRAGAGFIVREDSQGFVDVAHYDTKEALDSAWSRIQADDQEVYAESLIPRHEN